MRRIDADAITAAPLWSASPAPVMEAGRDQAAEDAARREADYRAAVEQGFQKGQAEGLAQAQKTAQAQAAAWQQERELELSRAQAQYEQARKTFESLVVNLEECIRAEAARAEELAVEVAYGAVARLMGEGYAAGTLIPALVRHAMLEVDAAVETVLVSRQDAAMLDGHEGICFEVDGRLLPGQCRLRTRLGSYDSGLDVRLDMLRTALLAGLSEHRSAQGAA
ncbi:FliH/SctL family protein [Stenotrophomonas acidaminiphila]